MPKTIKVEENLDNVPNGSPESFPIRFDKSSGRVVVIDENGNEVPFGSDDIFTGGLVDYNDNETAGTPIVVTGGAGFVELTNDGLGLFTNKAFLPNGVTDVWDVDNDVFDWTQLKLGDMIDIRLDIQLITTSVNTAVEIELFLGSGGGSFSIPWVTDQDFKNAATHKINSYNGIFMGTANILAGGGVFKISSDKNCTVIVNGWYVKIIQKG